jgi:hypothetical protein
MFEAVPSDSIFEMREICPLADSVDSRAGLPELREKSCWSRFLLLGGPLISFLIYISIMADWTAYNVGIGLFCPSLDFPFRIERKICKQIPKKSILFYKT